VLSTLSFSPHKKKTSTGASAGIGAACARQYAAEGCHLILLARRLQALENIRDEIALAHPAVKLHLHQMDVRDGQAVADFIQVLSSSLLLSLTEPRETCGIQNSALTRILAGKQKKIDDAPTPEPGRLLEPH
jgi:NAD(P)-dependent dehydrogenase (short-subunit alcohol dehydrogenase family)